MYILTYYNRLHVHIWASDITVVRAARRKIRKSMRRAPSFRAGRKDFYRRMLVCHRQARELAKAFRL